MGDAECLIVGGMQMPHHDTDSHPWKEATGEESSKIKSPHLVKLIWENIFKLSLHIWDLYGWGLQAYNIGPYSQ